MSLNDQFKFAMENVKKEIQSDNVIVMRTVSNSNYINPVTTSFDFLTRIVTVQISSGTDRVIQFKDFDRDVLNSMYDYLVQQGKHPVALPAIAAPEPDTDDFPFQKQNFGPK